MSTIKREKADAHQIYVRCAQLYRDVMEDKTKHYLRRGGADEDFTEMIWLMVDRSLYGHAMLTLESGPADMVEDERAMFQDGSKILFRYPHLPVGADFDIDKAMAAWRKECQL